MTTTELPSTPPPPQVPPHPSSSPSTSSSDHIIRSSTSPPPIEIMPNSPSLSELPSSPVDQLLDLGSLTSSDLPDLTLNSIQHKLSLDLGPTDLSVTLEELRAKQAKVAHRRSSNPPDLLPPSNELAHNELGLSFDPHDRSRRWTSLSELGRSVVKGSPSTYRARSLQRSPLLHAGLLSTHPRNRSNLHLKSLAPPSLYSISTRNRLNVFRLFNHDPPIDAHRSSSPDSSPASSNLPVLPPMSELLDESVAFDKDLGSIIDLTTTQDPSIIPPKPPVAPISPEPTPVAQQASSPPTSLSADLFSPSVLPADPAHEDPLAVVIDSQVERPPSRLSSPISTHQLPTSTQAPRHSESSVPNPQSHDDPPPIRVLSMSEADSNLKIDEDILDKLPKPTSEELKPSIDESGDQQTSEDAPTKSTHQLTTTANTIATSTTTTITTTTSDPKETHTKPQSNFIDSLRRKKKSPGGQANFLKLLFLKGFGQKSHLTSTTQSS